MIAPIENILFFDEADKVQKLTELVLEPIISKLGSKDPEILRSAILLLWSVLTVLTQEVRIGNFVKAFHVEFFSSLAILVATLK